MSWTKIGTVLHNCPKPSRRTIKKCGFPVGSEWTCDECGQVWIWGYQWDDVGCILDRVQPEVRIQSATPPDAKCGEKL